MIDLTASLGNWRMTREDELKVANDPRGPVIQKLRRVGRLITAAAKKQVGKQSNELAESIHYNIQRWNGLPEVRIGSENKIAYLHHEGTRPHAIVARNAQFLRFSSRGRVVYARSVAHPGTKPNKYLTDNLYLAKF